MDDVERHVDRELGLTVIAVRGDVPAGEIELVLEAFYAEAPTPLLLWDLSQADFAGLAPADLRRLILLAKRRAHLREGGRSALVASRDLEFGMARMGEILAEVLEHPAPHKAFRTRDEALAWLVSGGG